MASDYRRAMVTMLEASAAPYGYTVTMWSSGAVAVHLRGSPGLLEIALFAGGAVVAFALLAVLLRPAARDISPLPPGPSRLVAGSVDFLAVGLAVGVAGLAALIPTQPAWALVSFVATALYLLIASLQLALAAARAERSTGAVP